MVAEDRISRKGWAKTGPKCEPEPKGVEKKFTQKF